MQAKDTRNSDLTLKQLTRQWSETLSIKQIKEHL